MILDAFFKLHQLIHQSVHMIPLLLDLHPHLQHNQVRELECSLPSYHPHLQLILSLAHHLHPFQKVSPLMITACDLRLADNRVVGTEILQSPPPPPHGHTRMKHDVGLVVENQ